MHLPAKTAVAWGEAARRRLKMGWLELARLARPIIDIPGRLALSLARLILPILPKKGEKKIAMDAVLML